jgi:2-dehydropantoate 2-reductase
MKILVSGIGGVGGYVAATLCKYQPDVTLIARGKRRKALEKNGLVIHSERMGEAVFHPTVLEKPAAAGVQDVVFVCVKNFSLLQALEDLLPCIAEHTLVVPVLNGIDHYEVARDFLPKGLVINALIYITAAYNEDYSITQTGNYARILVDAPNKEKAQLIASLLNHEGITDCYVPEDMDAEMWTKYITNCAYNTLTARYQCPTRGFLNPPERLQEFRTLLDEACAVAKAKKINIADNLAESIYNRMTHERNLDSTSSMARDVMAHHPIELETFSGYLVRTAHELQVPVPMSERMYKELQEITASYNKN